MDIYKIVKDYQKSLNPNFEDDARIETVASTGNNSQTMQRGLSQARDISENILSPQKKLISARKSFSPPVLSLENIRPDLDKAFTINQLKEKYQVNYTALRVFFKNNGIRFDHFLQRYTYKRELEVVKGLFDELKASGMDIENFSNQKSIAPTSLYSKLLSFGLVKETEYNPNFPLVTNSLKPSKEQSATTEQIEEAGKEKNDLIEDKATKENPVANTLISASLTFNNDEMIVLKEFAGLLQSNSNKENESFIPVMIKHSLYMKMLNASLKQNMQLDTFLENAINVFAEKENSN